jgi:hypothetical protein
MKHAQKFPLTIVKREFSFAIFSLLSLEPPMLEQSPSFSALFSDSYLPLNSPPFALFLSYNDSILSLIPDNVKYIFLILFAIYDKVSICSLVKFNSKKCNIIGYPSSFHPPKETPLVLRQVSEIPVFHRGELLFY